MYLFPLNKPKSHKTLNPSGVCVISIWPFKMQKKKNQLNNNNNKKTNFVRKYNVLATVMSTESIPLLTLIFFSCFMMNEFNSKVKARRFVQLSSTYGDWSSTAHRLMSLILWDSNRRKADGFEPMTAAIVKRGSFKFYSHQESRRLAVSSGILKVAIGLTSSYYLGER